MRAPALASSLLVRGSFGFGARSVFFLGFFIPSVMTVTLRAPSFTPTQYGKKRLRWAGELEGSLPLWRAKPV